MIMIILKVVIGYAKEKRDEEQTVVTTSYKLVAHF